MPTVKKLQFANGTNITPPADLTLETAVDSLPTFADDAAYDVKYVVKEGSIYLNTTLKSPRMYLGGAWRTGIMQNNATDATKQVVLDTDGALTGVTHTLDFNGTLSRTYTFPDTSATVVLTLGSQELEEKTIKNGFLDGTKIRNGALDVEAAGALKIGENIGPHTLILGGSTSAVVVPGSLFVEGTTTSIETVNLDVEDKNITVNKGGNDAVSEGAGLTVDRTGLKGSLIYRDSAPNKFAAGVLNSEKNLAAIEDITVSNLSGTIPASKGGTGVANNDSATLTRSGDHALTLTTTGVTSLTLPTTGTVVTEDGSAVLLNKTTVSSTNATTGALRVPAGTTGEQPSPATQGMIRYNTTDATFEGYDGTEWGAIGGGGGGTLDVINQVGHSLAVGDVVYLNGSTYTKAKADAANTAEVVGVVSKVNTPDQFELTLSGEVSGLTGLVAGEVYFLSADTAGALTVTEPTVVGQVSLPVGVASSTTSLYVAPKRGSVVGSSNARTQIALANNATTNVQNISAYDAGELTGWISITATTPLRFYVAAQFSKNGAANNYNVSYQVSGDTVPTGFSVTATAAGLLQVTLPSVTGFASASINYALNAPAIGTTFPLSIDASSVVSGTVSSDRLPSPTTYSDAVATRMGAKQYLHGTSYNGGIAPTVTCSQAGSSIQRAVFIPYQMQGGEWRVRFNVFINYTAASVTSVNIAVNGMTIIEGNQACSGTFSGNNGIGRAYANAGAGGSNSKIYMDVPSALTTSGINFSGDIELNSKPTWAY